MSPTNLLSNRCLVLASLLVLGILIEFWAVSRYPALLEKAAVSSRVVEAPVFDAVYVIDPSEPVYLQTVKLAANWGKTNLRGMVFGILLGAALMSLIALLRRKSFSGAFANSTFGVLLGMPLGVCVNCAAPILRGLHVSGLRLETVIAAMISSPTLNVIVLAMLFALFPLYIAAIKVAVTLCLLLIVVPLLGRYVGATELSLSVHRALAGRAEKRLVAEPFLRVPTAAQEARWSGAMLWLSRAFLSNLWFVARVAVPLMVVAGLLGALTMVLVPFDTLTVFAPLQPPGVFLIGMLLTAVVGVVLPVPITFDILLVAALSTAGIPPSYAAVLLVTLGAYSVYSGLMVAHAISTRIAVLLGAAVVLLGVAAGLLARFYGSVATV